MLGQQTLSVPPGGRRPLLLSGHERALNQIKFNREGDLLFSCSKDNVVNVWYSHNGERLGTYEGNNGSVWSIDPDHTSSLLITGSAANQMKLYEVASGKCIFTWEFDTAVKRVAFSEDGTQVLAITEQRMGFRGTLQVFRINRDPASWTTQSREPLRVITFSGPKATVAAWAPADQYIVTGHDNGKVALYYHDEKEPESGVDAELEENSVMAHPDHIVTDLQMSADKTYCITSSKDKTSKLIDTKSLSILKTYTTATPLNSAAIHPTRPYVIIGGGQDAMNVTTTSARQGRFEARFWHKVFEEECSTIGQHFGPIHSIIVHPSGKCFASGGEDGYVRVNWFDQSFFNVKPYGPQLELAAEDI
ncbi:putative TIF34-translation initiation factor eIF3, p39 subunit [Tilletiopsis washingtonensis]|uniref:Eukaryotic translation initiation factor 3 subunit I n=1 Tax=Tilletiopsis washingtonensis TaxID=58919 RepID=A0A316ZFG8_9BASI|nr:putative TIF34-translation initiation factor eIF3, p39 subunit [Tilletiopsis washingtonensis]PWN99768.1 putative TIF34-translation initiation factor eIF3, p39 subunit [Tilletiopsis washingtonensis]